MNKNFTEKENTIFNYKSFIKKGKHQYFNNSLYVTEFAFQSMKVRWDSFMFGIPWSDE